MTRYLVGRMLLAVPIFLGVVTIVFVVVRILPGDPAQVALGDYASRDAVEALRQRLGLDRPIPFQYGSYLAGLVRGDLGTSLITGAPVRDEIAHNLPYTLQLTVLAMIVGALIGVPVGVVNALTRNRLPDSIGRVLSLLGLSVPAYYLGILLILLFAIELRALPAVGAGDLTDLADSVRHLILPAGTLGLVMAAAVARFTRSTVLNTLGQDFVRTARAKGLPAPAVMARHTLRAALIPIVSLAGLWSIALIGDSVTTEIVFARPGLGSMMVGTMLQRDYTSLQSVMVVYTAFVVLINLATDVAYGFIDPRIRY
ncbi:MAG: ABC transporter permease [Bacillati bacterium ANGP1]|uniref:ABC transporter permease n=1 Tax=Candidatus Segetimicrobium genomatis TaxID=2569760 RepID=A0A537JMB7_9BACT|nr:MAG: ABC transporter permease [Terrabacteria group bacterium ANGP1]